MTLGLVLAIRAGLVWIPLALALLLSLFNYAYVLLEQVANGAREPPVLALEMLNPLNQQRPAAAAGDRTAGLRRAVAAGA